MKRDTRTIILKATSEILLQGNPDPSMAEIAKKSGVTKSSLYYFFQSKKDLLQAVMFEKMHRIFDLMREVADEDFSKPQKLQKMMQRSLAQLKKQKGMTQLLFQQIFADDKALLQKITEKREEVVQIFAEVMPEEDVTLRLKSAHVVVGLLDFLIFAELFPCPRDKETVPCNYAQELCEHLLSLFYPNA